MAGGNSSFLFFGNHPSSEATIGGAGSSQFHHFYIYRENPEAIELSGDIEVDSLIEILQGQIDLKGHNITLTNNGAISFEQGETRIKGDSGEIVKTMLLNAPTDVNPGNLGLQITSTDDMGMVTIRRGHQVNLVNNQNSIQRYYKVTYTGADSVRADYSFRYLASELNSVYENELQSYSYTDAWKQRTADTLELFNNTIVKSNIGPSDSLWTFGTGTLQVSPKIVLEGNYAGAGLMTDNLRAASLIPLTEPYTALGFIHIGGGGESLDSTVLTVTGNDAIVDWVFCELRNKTDSTNVLQTVSALVQKDGDVVDVDGVSPILFASLPDDDYFLTIRHRNHFGVMSASPQTLDLFGSSFDFTDPATATYSNGAAAQSNNNGVMVLISGDSNNDGEINATDNNNAWLPQNGQAYNYQTSTADFNLDGTVNAVDKNNILIPNNSKVEQLPGN